MAIKQYFATFLQRSKIQSHSSVLLAVPLCIQPVRFCLSVKIHVAENTSGTILVQEVKFRFEKCLWFLQVVLYKETDIYVNSP